MSEKRAVTERTKAEKKLNMIDPDDPKDIALLKDLQGNIVKGHDRDHAVLIFLHFNSLYVKEIRSTIREQVKEKKKITSAWLQLQETKLFRNHGIPGGIFINFFLTASGYRALGYDADAFADQAFRQGMLADATRTKLNDPERWRMEEPYRQDIEEKTIHAMILLADDDVQYLGRQVRLILNEMIVTETGDMATLVAIEHGFQRRDARLQPIEHFGYRDGIGNPRFLNSREEDEAIDDYGGSDNWDPRASREVVLVPDPHSKGGGFGSYCVYRKIAQHVRAFEVQVRNLAQGLGLNSEKEEDLEYVRALIAGRFRDGTPVTLEDSPYDDPYPAGSPYNNSNYNDFNYADDPGGSRCPLHAHIRKVTPRDRVKPEEARLIARRGITYGSRPENEEGIDSLPNDGVGLLFMCYQNSIEKQFELIQSEMANAPDFPEEGVGHDPVIGQFPDAKQDPPAQNWPTKWGETKHSYRHSFATCVALQGGEYFFAPSISFLSNL
jgi:Dyp-type peroxidase family